MTNSKSAKSYGAREWSTKSVNCYRGCSHGCRYCYAMGLAIQRKQVTDRDQWLLEQVRLHDVFRGRSYLEGVGRVMFPTTHDITPENLFACFIVLERLLKAGNEVLVVSKPHLECIKTLCKGLKRYRRQILFRFTIGAMDDSILSIWEPNAPSYDERKAALIHAFENGFQASVSVEPMLDSANIDDLVHDLLPFVTDALWIGEMNHIDRFVDYSDQAVARDAERIRAGQTDEVIRAIYNHHKANPQIKWKQGIKKIVGIPLALEPGLDI